MDQIQELIQKSIEICSKYEKKLNYENGKLYDIFREDMIKMSYFLSLCDGNFDTAELTTINQWFGVSLTKQMYIELYGDDYSSGNSYIKNIPDSIKIIAKAEKESNGNFKCFLEDTRTLYSALKFLSRIIINCNGARLKFEIMCADYFFNNISDYICKIEEKDVILDSSFNELFEKNVAPSPIDEVNISAGNRDINEILKEVDNLIGLNQVKKEVHDIVNLLMVSKLREKQGLKSVNVSRHMVFLGNPGTGKTTIARLLTDIFKELGVISNGQLIEVDRGSLVSGYMGQTAERVKEVIKSAIGGVLFIDEAYTLAGGINDDYGREAIDTLLKAMEDQRDEFIVIVAGYPSLMNKFLDSNPGLRSRFNRFVIFENYSKDELVEIFKLFCREQEYIISDNALDLLDRRIQYLIESNGETFANARDVRNYFEEVITNQANRIVKKYGFSTVNDSWSKPLDINVIEDLDL